MKKIISLFLCVIIAFSCCTAGFAKTKEPVYPLVVIEGIMIEENYLDYGTDKERNTLSEINIPLAVLGIVKAIVFGSILHDSSAFVDGFCSTAREALKYFRCDKDGNSVYDIQSPKYTKALSECERKPVGEMYEPGLINDAAEYYGAENCYFYAYDWRLDPLDNADEINELIETAKKDHNCDMVNLVSASLGGVNALAYLTKYGSDSIHNCIFLSSAFCGTYVATDLFKGEIDFNGTTLSNFLISLIGDVPVIPTIIRAINKTGIIDFGCSFLNKFIEKNKRQIYDEVLRDSFATMPSLWAVVLTEEYDECMDFMFNTDELKTEYAGLIKRADALQEMMKNRDLTLNKAIDNGMNVMVVASYNLAPIPAYKRADVQGDGTLETELMLGGATVAKYGETLGDNYNAIDPGLVSPDNIVDLSTSLYPEYTWVVKNEPHVGCIVGSDFNRFIFELTEADEQPTADSYRGYSRFMCVDKNQNFIEFQ